MASPGMPASDSRGGHRQTLLSACQYQHGQCRLDSQAGDGCTMLCQSAMHIQRPTIAKPGHRALPGRRWRLVQPVHLLRLPASPAGQIEHQLIQRYSGYFRLLMTGHDLGLGP